MRGRLLYGALAIVIMVAVAACDEKLSDLTGPTENLEPTFSSIQNEIFSNGDSSGRVACTQCHNLVGGRFNGLDLSPAVSYGNLVGVASRGKVGAVRVIPASLAVLGDGRRCGSDRDRGDRDQSDGRSREAPGG